MSLITTIEQLKKHVSVASSFHIEDFQPYETKAVNTFTKRYIGNLQETIDDISSEESEGEDQEIIAEAKNHLESTLANLGMFLFMPYLTVLMDSSGISIVNNDQRSTAQWWQIKDIRRDLLRAGLESLDLLLDVLENNLEIFEDYAENFSAINNQLIVNNATTFSKYYNINNSRQTYLALQPTIRSVEDQYINTMLCGELVTALKTNPEKLTTLSEAQKTALATLKETLNKAIVAFTVSKVASIGIFLLDSSGLRLNFETFIDGKQQAIDSGKPSEQIRNLENDQISNGNNYLQIAKKYIQDNLSLFTQCESPLINSTATSTGYKAVDTKGVFGL